MAAPPVTRKITAADLPDDWPSAKDKLLQPLNDFLSSVGDGLSSGLRLSQNLGCQVATVRLQVPSDWTALTLNSPWAFFGATQTVPACRKDAWGRVYLKGLVKSGSTGTNVATLPVGYRPSEYYVFPSVSSNGASDVLARVDVRSDGTVGYVSGASPASYLTLDAVSFQSSDSSPYVPSCFPLKLKCTLPGGQALKVDLGVISDVTPSAAPLVHSATRAVWRNDAGNIAIDNIPGLLPGRTYSVTVIAYPK